MYIYIYIYIFIYLNLYLRFRHFDSYKSVSHAEPLTFDVELCG